MMARIANSSICFLLWLSLSLLITPTFAVKKSYVVYLGAHSHGHDVDYDGVTDSHYAFLGSFLGNKEKAREAIFDSYTRHINGFAANLEESEAHEISRHPDVVSVFLNRERSLHTTRSWEFMQLEHGGVVHERSLWKKARYGEDIIIANLDTGVWPESESFKDDEMGPIPAKWKGICQNDQDPTFHCNRKLIGARYFNKGYASLVGTLNSTKNSPRDDEGHGSHSLSTAGGNFVAGANVFGFGNGTAKGGSPKARVAAYKVCWPKCPESDILAAFDMAIHDGVDVISVSLGGTNNNYLEDGASIGSFHAVKHGITVICSAGNDGLHGAGTVGNVAPWHITVGASTMDRQFPSYVVLGNNKTIKGESLSPKAMVKNKYYPIVSSESVKATNASENHAKLCMAGSLDPEKAEGKILVCLRGISDRVDKGHQAALVGAVGMILANDQPSGNEVIADPHLLPATHIGYSDGLDLYDYIASTKSPVACITYPTTEMLTKPAPMMAAFSSRGPNTVTPEILKPDITAPGVSVIAAFSQTVGPAKEPYDERRVLFNSLSGTSMSCPHVSGVVGLLKTVHPDWSPAAIKSALMTSARSTDNAGEAVADSSHVKASPFSSGAGHVWPNRAMDPGLVYDLTFTDYLSFFCANGYNETQIRVFAQGPFKCPEPISLVDWNYPSITVPNLQGSVTVSRRLKNVGKPGTYHARVVSPPGFRVEVYPKTLEFKRIGEEKTFKVTINATSKDAGKDYVFGRLRWSDGKHFVRSPIVLRS